MNNFISKLTTDQREIKISWDIAYDNIEGYCIIEWSADFRTKKDGIDRITTSIKNFNCELTAILYEEELDKNQIQQLLNNYKIEKFKEFDDNMLKCNLHIDSNDNGWTIDKNFKVHKDGNLSINNIEIDIDKKIIILY